MIAKEPLNKAARFKQRGSELDQHTSPSGLLVAIAETEYDLKSLEVPEAYRDTIAQNLTDSHPGAHGVGEVRHATGVILRSQS